jgi:ferritin-like protein
MPPKSNPITVKIESQLCSRVEDVCQRIEKHLAKMSLDPIKSKIISIAQRLSDLEESLPRDVRDIHEDLTTLVDVHWCDLKQIQQTEVDGPTGNLVDGPTDRL